MRKGADDDGFSHYASDAASSADGGDAAIPSEDASNTVPDLVANEASASNDGDTAAIPATDLNIINQVEPLQVIAKTESTRSYFLAQTLESTRTVPMVSAKLPIDTGVANEPSASTEGASGNRAEEDPAEATEGGEDSDESELVAPPTVAAESTVIGSFAYRGITYAVEPGGESVAVVAADYAQLPADFIEAQIIVLPSQVTPNNIDFYSVTRIANNAFAAFAAASTDCNDNTSVSAASSADPDISLRIVPDRACDDIPGRDAIDEIDRVTETTDDFYEISVITIPASISIIEENAFSGLDTLQCIVVSVNNPSYSSSGGCLYDKEGENTLFIPKALADTPVLNVTYSAHYAVEQSEALAISDFREASVCAFSNDLLEVIDDKLIAVENGTTEIALAEYSKERVIIRAATVVVSAPTRPEGGNYADMARDENVEKSNDLNTVSHDVYINEAVALYAETGDSLNVQSEVSGVRIDDLFEFDPIDGKTGEVAVRAKNTNIMGAISIPFSYTKGGQVYKVTVIADNGFSGCEGITSVTIPNFVHTIGLRAFAYCSSLETLSLPSGVEGDGLYLGSSFLEGIPSNNTKMPKVKELYLPACVTGLHQEFLNGNTSVQTITADQDNLNYCSIDGILFTKDRKTIVRCPAAWKKDEVDKTETGLTYSIPSNVTTLAVGAFHSNQTIKELHIPDSVTQTNPLALKGMALLREIYSYGNPSLANGLFHNDNGKDYGTLVVHCIQGAKAAWEAAKASPSNMYGSRLDIQVMLDAYTVVFNANGKIHANMPQNQTISSGSKIIYQEPSCNGYKFEGWYTDTACRKEFAFSSVLIDNAYLYAKWSAPIPYEVSYSGGEPTSDKTTTYTVESAPFSFAAPADRRGYVFKGWTVSLKNAGQGNLSVSNNGKADAKVTPGCPDTYGDLTVTALWGAKSYKMAFDISTFADATWNPDENPNGKYDEVEYDKDATFPEVVPVKTGWRFAYWVRTDEPDGKIYRAGQKVTQANFCLEQDATATFEAHWVENLDVEVPLSSQNVGLEVSADFTADPATATFDVKKGLAKIVNRSDAALKVVSIEEDGTDENASQEQRDALQDRKDAVKDMFDARDNGQSILDAILANGAVKLALAPAVAIEDADAADIEEAAYETDSGKGVSFALFGGSGDMKDLGWVIPASAASENGAKARALRVVYDMRFADDAPMSILDMKINLENKTISKLVYTMALADSITKPTYTVKI